MGRITCTEVWKTYGRQRSGEKDFDEDVQDIQDSHFEDLIPSFFRIMAVNLIVGVLFDFLTVIVIIRVLIRLIHKIRLPQNFHVVL